MVCFLKNAHCRTAESVVSPALAPGLMPMAFVALAVSALARIFWAPAPAGFLLAVAAWVLGYALFLRCYTPRLFRARPDSQPG